MTLIINSLTITKVSVHLPEQIFWSTNIIAGVIPALRKLTVEVADDDVSGKSAVSIHFSEIANLY
jgi:hypothetical protein